MSNASSAYSILSRPRESDDTTSPESSYTSKKRRVASMSTSRSPARASSASGSFTRLHSQQLLRAPSLPQTSREVAERATAHGTSQGYGLMSTKKTNGSSQLSSQRPEPIPHERHRLVRALTPLLTQEGAFALADAYRREERDRRAREVRLSVTKAPNKLLRRTMRLGMAIKSSAKRFPATPSRDPPGTPGASRMTPQVNRSLTSMRAVAIPDSDVDASENDMDEGTDSDGYNPSKPLVKLKLVDPRPPPAGRRVARKTFGHGQQVLEISDSSEDERQPPDTLPFGSERSRSPLGGEVAEERDDDVILIDIESLSLGRTVINATKDPKTREAIASAIYALPHNHLEEELLTSRRLPFLKRNLRKVVEQLAVQLRRPESRASSFAPKLNASSMPRLKVEFNYGSRCVTGYQVHGWRCPLCRMIRSVPFSTKAGLELHLSHLHSQCGAVFTQSEDGLVLQITLPEVPLSDDEGSSDDDMVDSSSDSERELYPSLVEQFEEVKPFLARTPTPEQKPFLRGSSVFGSRPSFAPSPFKVRRDSSPPPTLFLSQTQRSGSLASVPPQPQRPHRPEDPRGIKRYPTPPPYADLEGPACVPPFTPESLGLPEDWYSTRPGGPRCYDALQADDMRVYEKLGILAWHVSEQEEDFFELNSILDADKAIRALWARFIALHRRDFRQDFNEGTRMFINDNWLLIHKAAGFAALRVWLLMLVHNRLLTGPQYADLLKYYKDIVGMDLWQKYPTFI